MKRHITDGLIKKNGTLAVRYEFEACAVVKAIASGERKKRWHRASWSKSRGHYALVDETDKMADVLKALGIRYSIGNDAPKQGADGRYIEAVFDGRNKAVQKVRAQRESIGKLSSYYDRQHDFCCSLFADIIKEAKP